MSKCREEKVKIDTDVLQESEENNDSAAAEDSQNQKKFKKRYSQHFRIQWLRDPRNSGWLRRIEGDGRKCFCLYCNAKLTSKLSDIEKHRNTRKHKNSEGEYYSLNNLKINESLSEEELYNESLHSAFRIDDSFRDGNIAESVSYGSEPSEYHVKRLKTGEIKKFPIKQEVFLPTESYVSKEEDEIDSFAKSIAAQMKMLREEDTIELTFEIQNLVTQRRRKLMEEKLAEKQVESHPQQQVITVSVDHQQLANVGSLNPQNC